MFTTHLKQLLIRDLNRLEKELHSFSDEKNIWQTSGAVSNSAGHLTLHLCGNLRHFVGHILGGTSYSRNREHEFNSAPIATSSLMEEVQLTRDDIEASLDSLAVDDLLKIYPVVVFKEEMTTQFFLMHLSGHLNYHLGQINYLRRMNS